MRHRVTAFSTVALLWSAALLAAAEGVWLDVPFVRQDGYDNGCGAASLAMILGYWRERGMTAETADAGTIYRQLYAPERKGLPADAMQRYLEAHGFRAFAFTGEWADLRHHLEGGRPLIVALKVEGDSLHYAVVAGASEDTVSLNDPADRKLRLYSRVDFEKKWLAARQWTLLAVPLPKP